VRGSCRARTYSGRTRTHQHRLAPVTTGQLRPQSVAMGLQRDPPRRSDDRGPRQGAHALSRFRSEPCPLDQPGLERGPASGHNWCTRSSGSEEGRHDSDA
jgi:hypothetical protein